MAKLRKMLGDIYSPECTALMRLIETQSMRTLATWAADYSSKKYLPIYKKAFAEYGRLDEAIKACKAYLDGGIIFAEIKPRIKDARELAAAVNEPTAQAAARGVATACAVVLTPTNALGFLLYGAAAVAYDAAGLDGTARDYDAIAAAELNAALESLRKAAVAGEPNPVKISWNC